MSVDGEEYKTSEPSFDISFALKRGEQLDVKVKAIGDGEYYKDSEWSQSIVVSPLVLKLGTVPGGKGYQIEKCESAFGDIVLPQEFIGIPIIGIGFAAFENLSDITSVTIPRGYIKIGYKVFSSCENLKTLRISDTVAEISKGCFDE